MVPLLNTNNIFPAANQRVYDTTTMCKTILGAGTRLILRRPFIGHERLIERIALLQKLVAFMGMFLPLLDRSDPYALYTPSICL